MIVKKEPEKSENKKLEYKFNNWKKVLDNDILNEIEDKGGAIWINKSGALCYRLSKNESITMIRNYKQANNIFRNFLNKDIYLIDGKRNILPDVYIRELKMIQGDRFEPFILEEFFEQDNLFYRNIFKPSKYLQIGINNMQRINIIPEYQEEKKVSFEAIKRLIMHLVNYDTYRFDYIINWLAYFFQELKKSQVALVLRGDQGAGKGIFFNEVIKPLFGLEYCTTINDKSLNSSYLGGIIEHVLFFNLDEISYQKTENKTIKNFLKALITNDTITAEKKFITLEKETKLYGQVLITSNEPHILDIEPTDRRYTIFNTGKNLIYTNFLGFDNYEKLSNTIQTQLQSFAQYLKNYQVDTSKANEALSTSEKEELQRLHLHQLEEKKQRLEKDIEYLPQPIKVHSSIINFANSIRMKNENYFNTIKFDNLELYNDIISDLRINRFKIRNLLPTFKYLHDDEFKIKYISILLKELAKYDCNQFHLLNYKKVNENDEIIDYISIIPYTYPFNYL
jgi:hypothetical protein